MKNYRSSNTLIGNNKSLHLISTREARRAAEREKKKQLKRGVKLCSK